MKEDTGRRGNQDVVTSDHKRVSDLDLHLCCQQENLATRRDLARGERRVSKFERPDKYTKGGTHVDCIQLSGSLFFKLKVCRKKPFYHICNYAGWKSVCPFLLQYKFLSNLYLLPLHSLVTQMFQTFVVHWCKCLQ